MNLGSRAHEPQLVNPRAATTELCMPRAHPPQEKTANRNKEKPLLTTTRESLCKQGRPKQPKINKDFFFFFFFFFTLRAGCAQGLLGYTEDVEYLKSI